MRACIPWALVSLCVIALNGCHRGRQECGDINRLVVETHDAVVDLDRAVGRDDAAYGKARDAVDKAAAALRAYPDPHIDKEALNSALYKRAKYLAALPVTLDEMARVHAALQGGATCVKRKGLDLPVPSTTGARSRYSSQMASFQCLGEPAKNVAEATMELAVQANVASSLTFCEDL